MIDPRLTVRLSELIYERRHVFELGTASMEARTVAWWDHGGTQGALVIDRDERWACIVFRGTEASKFRLRDIWSNAGRPVVWAGEGRVHSGYLAHLNRIGHKALEMAEKTASNIPLHVTGHSMGGALATLFSAWYFAEHPTYWLNGIATFGAPKAVSTRAAEHIDCPVQRYVLPGDPAPWWPPVPGLGHPASAIKLKPVNRWPWPVSRHVVGSYRAAIN